MRVWIQRVLLVGLSLAFCLPPAWCCRASAALADEARPHRCPACADASAPTHAPQRAPLPPANCPCCVEQGLVIVAKTERLPEATQSLGRLPFFEPMPCGEGHFAHAPVETPPGGLPRLHVLNCVWLC